MFTDCTSLVGSAFTAYDESHTNASYAHIDNIDSPGYFSDKSKIGIYVGFIPSTGTLVFRNDGHSAAYGSNVYTLNGEGGNPGWYAIRKAVNHVVFDPSFDDVHPTSTSSWFKGMSSLTDITGLQYLHTDAVTNMSGMFYDCRQLATLDLSYLSADNVTDMSSMFYDCRQLTTLDLSHFNSANVTDMSNMFFGCKQLTTLDLAGLNTAKVTDMNNMFSGCKQLATLDLSSFNTVRVTDMENMFSGCSALTTINVSLDWNTDAVTLSDDMFLGCTSLVGGNGTVYDAGHIDKTYACLSLGTPTPSYLTDNQPVLAYTA